MKKGKHRKKLPGNSGVGEILVGCLTKDQIAHLLNVVLSGKDVAEYADELKEVDSDMAETVEKIVALSSDKTRKCPVRHLASNKRILEHWDSLWSRWDSIVLEVGDEDGKYAIQDVDWEPPYFDGYTLAEDLDEIARDMLPHMDEIYDMVKKPALFYDAIKEIDSNIRSYPEWFGGDDGCPLGKHFTQCVLKWLWLGVQNDIHPGTVFLTRVCSLEEEFDNVSLDDDESISFFAKLPDMVCQEVYEQFMSNKYRQRVEETHSTLHKINHIYEQRFDSSKYLKTCRKYLSENWQYGKALIDDAIAQGDHQKSDSIFQKTFLSYLRRDEKNVWYPETSLLLTERKYYHENDEEEVAELLKLWGEVSEKMGNTVRSAASRVQSVMYRTPEDWDMVIREYRKLCTLEARKVIDPLFCQWKNEMAERSIHTRMDSKIYSDTWIHWLIESELHLTDKKEWFLKKLQVWLDHLNNDGKMFKQQWILLAQLTKDLSGSDNLRKQYPTFYDVVLPSDEGSSKLRKVRCDRLNKMGTGTCISREMDIWEKHLYRIVPDPANSHKSRYYVHAEWLKALYELSHSEYEKLLSRWRQTHKQRRNLWLDLKKYQLPI